MNILPVIKFKRNNLGFTLVELLVVIGILGILAAALVATIDPFEQIRRTNDSDVKNTAVEYLTAVTRYYTTHTAFPWDAAPGGACNTSTAPAGVALSTAAMIGCTTVLTNDGELKTTFASSANLSKVFVAVNSGNPVVCFKPLSKSGILDPLNKYTVTGGACATPSTSACYWCAQ